MNQRHLTTPYKGLIRILSSAEKDALRARIEDEGGVHDPALITEDFEVLDGHNRLDIDPKRTKTLTIKGSGDWTVAERKAFIVRCNRGRRNLTHDQLKHIDKLSRELAAELKAEGKTQKQIAGIFGVDRTTVSKWFTTNVNGHISSNGLLDCRVKVPPKVKEMIYELVEDGVTQDRVAADYGISQQSVSKIVNAERKKDQQRHERDKAAKAAVGDCGIIHADFRTADIAAESVQLIFTDPPYDKEAASLYGDLADFGAKVLLPGGWLLAYSGQMHLPEVLTNMSARGLEYAWVFCVLHSGGDLRFRKFKLQNGWKPIVAFFKPKLNASWEWFKDVCTGGKEKADHPWQQAVSEAEHFISRLTTPESIVCDPFAGSGTTLLAAKNLGRRWLGVEKDIAHVNTARGRLGGG